MHHLFTFRTLCTSQMFSVNDQKISYLKALNSTKTSTASSTLWRLEIISNLRICISNIDNSDLKHLILQSIILVRPQRWGGYRISDTFVPWISNTSSLLRLLVTIMAVGKIPFATLGNTAAYCFFPTPLSKISMKCYPLTALGMN